jgi:hypothetical protein
MSCRTSRLVLLFVSLLLVLCQPPSARAETPAETAAAFGLLGTWAVDCRLPPSLGNGYLTYAAAPGGNIAHDRDFGSQRNVGEIVRASLTAGGIDLVVFFPVSAQSRHIIIARAADGRLRTIADSFINTNEYAIRDGRLLATGAEMPWQMRCR